MGFRENLKAELVYQNIKVKELAQMTGISKHTLDHYLAANGSQPQAEPAVKIARALGTSVEALVCGERAEPRTRPALTGVERLSAADLAFVQQLVRRLGTGEGE